MRPIFEASRHPEFGPAYSFTYSRDREGVPQEGAHVRFAWNEAGLHILAELEDSCPIQQSRQNQQLHYETGDVFELFVKPLNDSYYWEMYATPHGNKTTLFFPRERADLTLDDFLKNHPFQGLEVLAEKIPEGWKTRMFVPAAQLTAFGAGWGDGTEWTVFCGRYNYNSDDLSDPELSMIPALAETNYHLTDGYACLKLF